ncbi:MAG TPA: carboxypeptidase-like regulatory domain-containing protein, partial [Vicinamibacterales bacterium]|nr:carboxypeptidase-like regulatory domain-containing protein [Vicinamibacterales bacterium]
MRRRKHSLTVALVVACAATVLAQNPPPRDPAAPVDQRGTGVIRGRVVTADRAQPIRNARVSILAAKVAEPVFTDDGGRFTFAALTAGRYQVVAEKTGFARARYGSANELDPAIPLDVAEGATVDVQIRMTNGAAISGRIVDETGGPVVGAPVTVAMLRLIGTETRLIFARPASDTDDRGEYRIGGLAPGRYVVNVAGATEGSPIPGAPPEWARTSGWSRTFYPGVAGAAAATAIVVGAGEERAGIDIALTAATPAKLTLSLVDASGAPIDGLINLFLPSDTGGLLANRGVPISPRNPKMTSTLDPGDWTAVVLQAPGGGKALAHVKLGSGDNASLTVTPGPGGRISGHVEFEGTSARPSAAGLRIAVRGSGPDAAAPAPGLSNGPGAVKPDGSFEITGVVGTVQIAPDRVGAWTMRSAKFGERDLIDDAITVAANEDVRDVRIVFTDRLVKIDGTVTAPDGSPAAG